MPTANYAVHFGVRPDNLGDVIPGVDGLETSTEGDSWFDWGIPFNERAGVLDAHHIVVVSAAPLLTIARIITHYHRLLVPSDAVADGWDSEQLVAVTNRWSWNERDHEGCYTLYAATMPVSNTGYIAELNATQGAGYG